MYKKAYGFTIIELLIVIVVIAILAAVTVVAYGGIQRRARAASVQADIVQVHKLIELYRVEHGEYPRTTTGYISATGVARTDANCTVGSRQADWVPNVGTLPQSDQSIRGAQGRAGCYMYVSNGTSYVLSAWNLLESPQTQFAYRRVGFRELSPAFEYHYVCNHAYIGGVLSGAYSLARDMYKYSYTYSNVTSCGEAPPTGA